MASIWSCGRAIGCCNATPTFDAGHGGMYRDCVTTSSPLAARAASAAVDNVHSPEPEPFGWWHDAHEFSRIGCTVVENVPPRANCSVCGFKVVGGTNLDPSMATRSNVNVASSPVEASPGMWIGPASNVDSFTRAVAVMCN